MPIIAHGDLAAYMGRTIAAGAAQTSATSIIEGLEADLETYLKRPIVPTAITDEVVKVDRDGRIYLRATPVVSVAGFTLNGTAVDADTYAVETWGLGQSRGVPVGTAASHLVRPLGPARERFR